MRTTSWYSSLPNRARPLLCHLLHRRTRTVEYLRIAPAESRSRRKPKAGSRISHPARNFPRPLLCLPVICRHLFGIQMQPRAQFPCRFPLRALMRQHQLKHWPQFARLSQQYGLGCMIQRNFLQHFRHRAVQGTTEGGHGLKYAGTFVPSSARSTASTCPRILWTRMFRFVCAIGSVPCHIIYPSRVYCGWQVKGL